MVSKFLIIPLYILFIIFFIALTGIIVLSLILVWVYLYNNYMKSILYEFKKQRIIHKINKYSSNDMESNQKSIPEDKLKEYEKFIQNDINKHDVEIPITLTDVELTERIKAIIDQMISVEVYSVLKQYITMNTKYPITNIDVDIKNISTKIFDSVNPDVFHTNLVFTNKYIMHYIVTQTFAIMLGLVTDFNSKLT